MGEKPYIEVGAGIENIFKVLRIDYVHRLTYRDNPNGDNDGMKRYKNIDVVKNFTMSDEELVLEETVEEFAEETV